jgi:hypothetical protein
MRPSNFSAKCLKTMKTYSCSFILASIPHENYQLMKDLHRVQSTIFYGECQSRKQSRTKFIVSFIFAHATEGERRSRR